MAIPLHGHVLPTLGLVTELVTRGHRVTFAIPLDFTEIVEDAGAAAVRYRSLFPSIGDPEREYIADDTDGTLSARLFRREAEAVLDEIESAYALDTPDMLVYDSTAYHAPVLARRWSVPEIQLCPTHVVPDAFVSPDNTACAPTHTNLKRCLVTIPRSFQVNADDIREHNEFVGPMLSHRNVQGDWSPPSDRPVVLVSLGSVYTKLAEFFRTCLSAFAGTEWHVVISAGEFFDEYIPEELPGNVEVHSWLPQLAVLKKANVFVTHGGMGSTMEALANGVRLIVLPRAGDQFVTGMRVDRLGLGRVMRYADVTARSLYDTVREVASDPEVAERVRRMRTEIENSGGGVEAADIVESHLPD